jgi:hypothetical protein
MMRGRGGKSSLSKRSSSSLSKSSSASRHGTTLATTYRGLTTGLVLAGPAITVADSYRGAPTIDRDTPKEIVDQYRKDAVPLAMGVTTHALSDMLGQKLFQHNSALGRGSITAWVSEAVPVIRAGVVARSDGVKGAKVLIAGKTGYMPSGVVGTKGTWNFDFVKDHLAVKVGGGIVRKLSTVSVFRNIAQPVKAGLSSMGASL